MLLSMVITEPVIQVTMRMIGILSKVLPTEVLHLFMSYNPMGATSFFTKQIGMTICLKNGNLLICTAYQSQEEVIKLKHTYLEESMSVKRSITFKIQKPPGII